MFSPFLTERIIHPLRCRLNRWHRDVSQAADELDKSEHFSTDELCRLQKEKLRLLCENAVQGAPYYRRVFSQAGIDPREITPETLSMLPVLERDTIRRHFKDIVNRCYPEKDVIQHATGGSSGEPLTFLRSRHDIVMGMALALRGMDWCGMKPGYPHVRLWGAPTDVRSATEGFKKKIWNYLYSQRVIDAFNAGPALFEKEHARLERNMPFLLESYSNILYEFARYIQTTGKSALSIPAVISSAGVLYDFQRQAITDSISANVFNRYGSREFSTIAHECPCHSGLHIRMERFVVEIVNRDQTGIGDILITDLENHAFPFIRYSIGDQGAFSDDVCACGMNLPMFTSVVGRHLDTIRTPSGRMISGVLFPHFFKDYPQIILGQVIQDTIDHIEIRLKLQEGAAVEDMDPLIRKILQACNNEVHVTVNTEQEFVVNPTGKYRPVISKLS